MLGGWAFARWVQVVGVCVMAENLFAKVHNEMVKQGWNPHEKVKPRKAKSA